MQLNKKSIISLDAIPNNKFDGTVTSISVIPVAKPQNSGVVVYEVKVGFSGTAAAAVKSGMSATVDIVTNEKPGVLLIPNKSIKKNSKGQTIVDTMVNQKSEERVVVLGSPMGTKLR